MGELLAKGTNYPMFMINGDQDAQVPLSDTQLL
jgi:hypothetical protein